MKLKTHCTDILLEKQRGVEMKINDVISNTYLNDHFKRNQTN